MLKRKISREFSKWKAEKDHKCALLQGAHQTGKTTSIRKFGEEYEEMIEINFRRNSSASEIFSGDLDVDTMVMALRFRFPEKRLNLTAL